MNDLLKNPTIVGLVVAIPSFILGLLAYRRSVSVDKITAQSQSEAAKLGTVNQIIEGLNKLVTNLQEDNKQLRIIIDGLNLKLDIATKKIDDLTKEVRVLNKRLKG